MGAIAGVFGWLFGGSSAADTIVTTAAKMVDDSVFTDQEKSQANGKLLDWYLKYQQATAPQNVARRQIAIMVTGLWALNIVLLMVAAIFGLTSMGLGLWKILPYTSGGFGTVMSFYFLKNVAETNRDAKVATMGGPGGGS